MLRKRIIKSLLKARLIKSRDLDALIDEFIRRQGGIAQERLSDLLASLYLDIMDRHPGYGRKEIIDAVMRRAQVDLVIPLDTGMLNTIYENTAVAFVTQELGMAAPLAFVFDEIDVGTLEAIRDNFFWLRDHVDDIQDQLKAAIARAFTGDISRTDLAAALKMEFEKIISQETAYYQSVSDHIINQCQNLARINQGEKYGAPYYRVVARMDDRTTPICRSLNGRIIPADHLVRQARAIEASQSIGDKKKAAGWQDEYQFGPLPKSLGIPPYHFRCRTILQPVWDPPEVMDENARGYDPGGFDPEALRTSLTDIRKEGVLAKDPSRRVILCGNGTVIVVSPTGTVERMQSGGWADLVDKTIFSKDAKVKKGMFSWIKLFMGVR